jgi:Zn-finger nucleic acid-binding protein
MATSLPTNPSGSLEVVRYLPCPVCKELMHRVNYANCSHVIVDVCQPHGTWFDRDELRRIVEFIRSGGLEKARQREIQALEQQRRALQSARANSPSSSGATWDADSAWPSNRYDVWEIGISAVAAVLGRWLR